MWILRFIAICVKWIASLRSQRQARENLSLPDSAIASIATIYFTILKGVKFPLKRAITHDWAMSYAILRDFSTLETLT